MCVIMAKPANIAFPEESILKNCWDNNPDMGGFMYALNGKVYIYKGYETWGAFKSALEKSREKTGDNIPYVCHFRISTQGFNKACCQPFPLSGNMNSLKKQRITANMGIAHNGIIGLTSDGSKEYSDTMKFITDYLVNIIRSYDWHKDSRTVKLIENLIDGSRLSIIDKTGFIKLLGLGWEEDKGCWFSNHTYAYKKYVYSVPVYTGGTYTRNGAVYRGTLWDEDYEDDEKRWADYWDKVDKDNKKKEGQSDPEWLDPWQKYYNKGTKEYNFSHFFCPYSEEGDDTYCEYCSKYGNCVFTNCSKVTSGWED